MRSMLAALITAGFLASAGCGSLKVHDEPVEAEQMDTVKSVTSETFKTVMPAMMKTVAGKVKSDGFASAVEFCNLQAPQIEAKFNGDLGKKFASDSGVREYAFKRTSLKIRNPKNSPDPLEEKVLKQWEKDLAAGKEIGMVARKVGDTYYGMMPVKIPGPLCLGCHGSPEKAEAGAMEAIRAKYPSDQATGYEVGDLRGALSVKFKM